MKHHHALLVCTLCILGIPAYAHGESQRIKELTAWLGKSAGQEKVLEILNQADIRLQNGEQATLIAAEFDRGFHFRNGYILARPKLKQARILKYWGALHAGIEVFPRGKRASNVLIGLCDHSWSSTYNERALVQFAGWKPVIQYRWESWREDNTPCQEK